MQQRAHVLRAQGLREPGEGGGVGVGVGEVFEEQHAARAQQRVRVLYRVGQRRDVVQGEGEGDGVVGAAPEVGPLRAMRADAERAGRGDGVGIGVDGGDVVAVVEQRLRDVACAAADFEQVSARRMRAQEAHGVACGDVFGSTQFGHAATARARYSALSGATSAVAGTASAMLTAGTGSAGWMVMPRYAKKMDMNGLMRLKKQKGR